eukprot:gene4586-5189_t
MEVISVVEHLHSLAINPRNRASIVKDQGCLPGLVLFLDNEQDKVVLTALKTLQLLAMHGPNRALMKNELGLLPTLTTLKSHSNPELKKYATETYNLLMGSRPSRSGNHVSVLGKSSSRAKVITLQVRGLHQATRKICEEQLLQVKGVISFTFNMNKARCIVRVKPDVDAKKLAEKINETKIMSAQQIIKNESGEEVVLSFGKCPVKVTEEKKNEMPDYLPEEEDVQPSTKVLVRKDQQKETGNSGWLSGVSNFITSSFYW